MGRTAGPLQQIFLRFAPEYTMKFGDSMPRVSGCAKMACLCRNEKPGVLPGFFGCYFIERLFSFGNFPLR